MKYNQGFVSWSPRSLTLATGGQGTIASSTGDKDFLNRCVGVQSHFVVEDTNETVSYLYYAQEFGNIIRLGMSPGRLYPGYERRNMLLHLLVPDDKFSWRLLWKSLGPVKFRRELSEDEINSTELPAIYKDDAEYSDNLKKILSKYGLDNKKKLAVFLQEAISVILGITSAIAIRYDIESEPDRERAASELTALIAAAMPKPVGDTGRYLGAISYVVGSTRNAGSIKFIYPGQAEQDIYTLDLTKNSISSKTEEALSVFSVLAGRIINIKESLPHIFEQLDNGEDPFWGDMRNLLGYLTGSRIEIADIEKSYHFWLMHEKKKEVHYEEIKDIYNELLIQTKAQRPWYRNFLFEYLRQETDLQQQSIIDLWKLVMRPAFIDRKQVGNKKISEKVWTEYLDIIFICMRFMYGKSRKNYHLFRKDLPSEEDWGYIQEKFWDDYEADKTASVLAYELSEVHSVSDADIFLKGYAALVKSHPEIKKEIHLKQHFEEYKRAADRKTRIKLHESLLNLGEEYWVSISSDIRKYISESETEEEVFDLISFETSRTEQEFVPDLYDRLIIAAESLEDESDLLQKAEQALYESFKRVVNEEKIKKKVEDKKREFYSICAQKREAAENREIDESGFNELLGMVELAEQRSDRKNFLDLEFDSSRRKWARKILAEIKAHKNELGEDHIFNLIKIRSDIINNLKQSSDETGITEFYSLLWEVTTEWAAGMEKSGGGSDYRQDELYYKMKLQIIRCAEGHDSDELHEACDIWREISRKECHVLVELINGVFKSGKNRFNSNDKKYLLEYGETDEEVMLCRDYFRFLDTIFNDGRIEPNKFEVLFADNNVSAKFDEDYSELMEELVPRIKNNPCIGNDLENLLILLSSGSYAENAEKCCEIYRRVYDDRPALRRSLSNNSTRLNRTRAKSAQFLFYCDIRKAADGMNSIDFNTNGQQSVNAYKDVKGVCDSSDKHGLDHIYEYEKLLSDFEAKKRQKKHLMDECERKITSENANYEEAEQLHDDVVKLHNELIAIDNDIIEYLKRKEKSINERIDDYNAMTRYDGERPKNHVRTQFKSPEEVDAKAGRGAVNVDKPDSVSNESIIVKTTETDSGLNQDEESQEYLSGVLGDMDW